MCNILEWLKTNNTEGGNDYVKEFCGDEEAEAGSVKVRNEEQREGGRSREKESGGGFGGPRERVGGRETLGQRERERQTACERQKDRKTLREGDQTLILRESQKLTFRWAWMCSSMVPTMVSNSAYSLQVCFCFERRLPVKCVHLSEFNLAVLTLCEQG